ncbi:hypothetical protein LCGC14_1038100 [marine sediment metagenome]|uniref:Uncharacterized protein n=1 Tax=marine sediment metagenome TaxID=412755 RepID=A0A0F9MX87_9ZZZZ
MGKKDVDLFSNFLSSFKRLGEISQGKVKIHRLIDSIIEALKTKPNSIALWAQLAESYNLTGQYKNAINTCKKILVLNQNYKPVFNNLFFAYDRLESFEEVIRTLKSYIDVFPLKKNNDYQKISYSLICHNYFRNNKEEPHLELYVPPNYPSEIIDINFNAGFHFSKIGWSLRSIELLKYILEKYPQDIDIWNVLGYSFLSFEKYNDAQNALNKALEIDKENERTHILLGYLNLKIKEYRKAEDEFTLIIQKYKVNQIPYPLNKQFISVGSSNNDAQGVGLSFIATCELGTVYNEMGEYEKALDICDTALKLYKFDDSSLGNLSNMFSGHKENPVLTSIYKNLGVAYYSLDNYKMALKSFKKALKFDRENGEVLECLGGLYIEMRKFKLASEIYQHVIGIKPEDPIAWHMLSLSYYKMGKKARAIEANSRCLSYNPNFQKALELRKELN